MPFFQRIAPVGVAAIYFGSFTLSPQDAPLSRQALFKLSFLNRHFLQPGGLKITVSRHTAILSGTITHRALVQMAEILALQIEGIQSVKDETQIAADGIAPTATPRPARDRSDPRGRAIPFRHRPDPSLRRAGQPGRRPAPASGRGQFRRAKKLGRADRRGRRRPRPVEDQGQ